MKLTLEQYMQKFQTTKEVVHEKIQTKQLSYTIEDGVLYIETNTQESTTPSPPAKRKTKPTVAMVIALYQKENQQLKEKIVQLEAKIDKLIDDKEQMLRDEMRKIEKVYETKDEQLKTILELMQAKQEAQNNITVHDVLPVSQEAPPKEEERIVELKAYLKSLNLTHQERKMVKKKFLNAYGADIRL